MMRALVLLALVLVPAALPGCLCEPLLEVRHCRPHQNHCSPDASDVREWTAADAEQFPEVDALLQSLAEGTHGHAEYTPGDEEAFWQHWGLDNSAGDQQVFVSYNDGIFRLRVYTCEGILL